MQHSEIISLREELLKLETRCTNLDLDLKKAVSDHNIEMKTLLVEHNIKIRELESAHTIALKDAALTTKYAKDEEMNTIRKSQSDMAEKLAVALKEKEMLEKMVNWNADLEDVKAHIGALIKKLPEVNISGGLSVSNQVPPAK